MLDFIKSLFVTRNVPVNVNRVLRTMNVDKSVRHEWTGR